jgi:hypothetical protein
LIIWFSEGDSKFLIRIPKPNLKKLGKGKTYYHISTTFELTQSRQDIELFNSYKTIVEKIAILFLSKLNISNLSKFDRTGK